MYIKNKVFCMIPKHTHCIPHVAVKFTALQGQILGCGKRVLYDMRLFYMGWFTFQNRESDTQKCTKILITDQ